MKVKKTQLNGIKRLVQCTGFLLIVGCTSPMPNQPDSTAVDDEIRYLIGSVGRNGCAFVRNDRRYSTRSARDHLSSKWRLNEQLVGDAEDFIEKIASQSATSGQPYLIRCRGEQETTARDWFSQLLAEYRAETSP